MLQAQGLLRLFDDAVERAAALGVLGKDRAVAEPEVGEEGERDEALHALPGKQVPPKQLFERAHAHPDRDLERAHDEREGAVMGVAPADHLEWVPRRDDTGVHIGRPDLARPLVGHEVDGAGAAVARLAEALDDALAHATDVRLEGRPEPRGEEATLVVAVGAHELPDQLVQERRHGRPIADRVTEVRADLELEADVAGLLDERLDDARAHEAVERLVPEVALPGEVDLPDAGGAEVGLVDHDIVAREEILDRDPDLLEGADEAALGHADAVVAPALQRLLAVHVHGDRAGAAAEQALRRVLGERVAEERSGRERVHDRALRKRRRRAVQIGAHPDEVLAPAAEADPVEEGELLRQRVAEGENHLLARQRDRQHARLESRQDDRLDTTEAAGICGTLIPREGSGFGSIVQETPRSAG